MLVVLIFVPDKIAIDSSELESYDSPKTIYLPIIINTVRMLI